MYVKFLLKVFFYSAFLLAALWLAGCSKNEHPIQEARYTTLDIKTFSIDTLLLKVMSNETTLTDTLKAPDGSNIISVQYADTKQRIRLIDALSDQVLLDTLISYNPGFVNALTFFQPLAGARFVKIGPPANEPLPPVNYMKLSISYTHAALPEVLKAVVTNSKTGGPDYEPSDSFELKKGDFSRYFLGRTQPSTRRPKIYFYTNDSQRKELARIESFPATVNPDYNIFLLRKHDATDGSVYLLRPEKLY